MTSTAPGGWGRPIRSVLFWALAGLAATGLVAGQPADPESGAPLAAAARVQPEKDQADPEFVASLINRVEARWFRRKALNGKGDASGATSAANELVGLLRDEKIERLESMAEACLVEGRREEQQSDYVSAKLAYRLADALDPGNPAIPWAVARTEWSGDRDYAGALGSVATALRARWGSFWYLFGDLLHVAAWVLVGLLATGVALVLVLLARHASELAHAGEERLPLSWHPSWRRAAGWTIVLGPLVVLVAGPWCLLIWPVALVLVATRAERFAIYAWLLVAALAVPAAGGLWLLSGVATSPATRVAVASTARTLQPDLLRELASLVEAQPDEPTWKILLARLLAQHHPDRALVLLRDAARHAPREPRVRVLLGNVFYRLGKYEQAGVEYREALRIAPADPVALFNLARVRLATFEFNSAEDLLGQARAGSRRAVQRLEARTPPADVAEPEFETSEVARQMLARKTRPGLADALRPANPVTLAALAALLVAFALRLRRVGVDARRCTLCGKPTCSRCAGRDGEACAACDQLLSRREGLDPAARQQQARRIEQHLRIQRALRTLLHIGWPGLSLVHEGRTWPGLAMAFTWAVLVTGILWPQHLLPQTQTVSMWRPGLPLLVVGLLVWLLFQSRSLRPRPLARRAR
ncbi:MAG: tetratricopeptide repeat protein [Acidobacteria bacterium]|nr:tetratricopeptide repeat protein [Acidobacteriota bacterium]